MNNQPEISVIMPVYNCELYLKQAIESILNQTYRDFEFIIINDGSKDSSEEIIKGYSDARILYFKNEVNIGLIKSLNKGISLARGKYIARMDGDDISLPERFSIQLNYLQQHPECSVLATTIQLINEKNEDTGFWNDDINTRTFEEIKYFMPHLNCIAHPSIMMRSEVAKEYLYSSNQPESEDWDMWLRILSDGKRIEKINQVLVQYRIHSESITRKSYKKNVYRKIFRLQRRYIINKIRSGKLNSYDKLVLKEFPYSIDQAFLKGKITKYSRRIANLFRNKKS